MAYLREISDIMKKYYIILAIIIASSIVVTASFLWINQQPTPASSHEQSTTLSHVYHIGDQIPNTYYTFGGFISGPDVEGGIGFSPQPTPPFPIVLSAIFKLNAAGESFNQSPGLHIVYGQEDDFMLNPSGNTTTLSGFPDLDNSDLIQFYTIVAYNVHAQTITMVYG